MGNTESTPSPNMFRIIEKRYYKNGTIQIFPPSKWFEIYEYDRVMSNERCFNALPSDYHVVYIPDKRYFGPETEEMKTIIKKKEAEKEREIAFKKMCSLFKVDYIGYI